MLSLHNIAKKEDFYIDYQASLKEAMYIMQKNKNGCVVLLEDDFPVAIVSESDILRAVENSIKLTQKAYEFASKNLKTANKDRLVEFAYDFLNQNNIKRVIVVDDEGRFEGVVLQDDLFKYIESDVYKVDLYISSLIKKSPPLITVDYTTTINQALSIMREEGIGSIFVNLQDNQMGILTQKDILKLTYKEVDFQNTILEYLSYPLISISKDAPVTDAVKLMSKNNIRRIAIHNKNNKIISMLTNRDILNFVKGNYTNVLQQKVKHAQEIMDILPEAIVEIFDSHHDETQIIYWLNEKAKDSFGENLLEKDLTALFTKDDWDNIYHSFLSSNSISKKLVDIKGMVYEVSGTISKHINTSYIKLILIDVTEYEKTKFKLQEEINTQLEKQLEQEYLLMQQTKLATMGEMIGHIAHQWRQPLSQLSGIFMNLDATYEVDELTPQYLNQKIKRGNELLKYMSDTIEDFRSFFRPNQIKEIFNLNQYIQNSINLISATLTYNHVDLEFNSYSSDILVAGYPSEFSQVILNILNNSNDALVANKIQNPKISIEVVSLNKDKISIKIQDNAGGIDESILDTIFDMYTTTKDKKHGTGLGMYISKIIIQKRLNGEIFATNDGKSALIIINLKLYH